MSHDDFPTDRPAVVTCGLPYATGDLHVGHLRTYISGDVLSRAFDTLGQDNAFVSGTDMHGTPVAVQAAKEGVEPEEYALRLHEKYADTFPEFGIEFDNYGHTHEAENADLTREFVRAWIDNDHVYEKEIEVAWDPEVDEPLPDRFVEGTCPYCGEKARGDECDEGCQRHLEPGEIENPTSTLTGNPAEYRTRAHEFLRLNDFKEYLGEFLDRLEGTSNARNQPREWVEGELQDLCITRDMDWGIDYPGESVTPEEQRNGDGETVDSEEDLVLYVWVDAPIEYVASTKQYSERVGSEEFDWEGVWKDDVSVSEANGGSDERSSSGGEIVHIIGRDIIQHHTVFWPAMLRGAGYNEPRAVMASGFVNLNGKAFSTSRNRAIWADDYLEEGFHPDLLRYYLVTAGGFQQDVDFAWDRFAERVNGELVGNVGNFWYRSLLFAYRNYEGTPEAEVSAEVRDRIEGAIEEFREGVNDYSLRETGRAATRLSRFGNEYIQRNEPWKLADDDPEQARVIRDCVQIAKAVSVLIEPVAPGKAETLWGQLDEEGSVHDAGLEAALVAPPREFGEPGELFEKIEDERVEELEAKLDERVASAGESEEGDGDSEDAGDESEDADLEPLLAERIGFEEFQNLDVRVGRIEAAEGIDGADDLARLEVDIGIESRQVVAGIKQLHDLSELPGEKCILLANMEPAELFGVESNGMILAAGDEADLLTTHGDAEPGERIR